MNRALILGLTLGAMASFPAAAQDDDERHSDAAAMNFVGDQYRIGIGYDSETDLTGEFFWAFGERPDAAWVAEGWFGDESAGGLKLNYHWLADGIEAGINENGDMVFSDGKVRKLFLAADRNVFDDRKVTFGGGSERNNRFWSLYGSVSTTGERYIGQTIDFQEMLVTGVIDNHAFSRLDTWETITDFYAHPYDWGVGFRVGRYFEDPLVRLRGGLDYESGDYDSSQVTVFASLDKRFENSRHGLSFRAEAYHKDGDFEVDQDDARISVFWTGEFGRSHAPARVHRDVQRERIPDPSELPRENVIDVIENRITMDNTASFELDSYRLNEVARSALSEVVDALASSQIAGTIEVVGHTCSLGTDEYNQVLSERRATAVRDYLQSQGVDVSMMSTAGLGESQPRYSNDSEESRLRNRRVEISFTALEETTREVIVGEGQAITEWVQEAVPVEAAWIRRALRNPVQHKRTVDFYRINRVTENHITGETMIENTGPDAQNDSYMLEQNSSGNVLNVLVNDSDPEGDTLTIVSVGTPANGTAQISNGTISYTPDADFYGSDQFDYTIEDGYGGSDTATVSITIDRINNPPIAVDDAYQVRQDTIGNLFSILDNDSEPDGDDILLISVSAPGNGTASLVGDQISYTPNPGFFGTDTFTYVIEESFGQLQAQATVTVEVQEFNYAPVANDDFAVTAKDTAVVIDVLANDFDQNRDMLTIIETIQDDHPMGIVRIINNKIVYTPMSGWWGGDSFQYVVSDGKGLTDTATVTLDVTEQ